MPSKKIKVLFFGDIVGRPGRQAIKEILPQWRGKYDPDFIFANIENLAGGGGVTDQTYTEMAELGIDYFTSGNHVWEKDGFQLLSDSSYKILRPLNYPEGVAGRGAETIIKNSISLRLINLQGLTFMKDELDSPFRIINKYLAEKQNGAITIIDFHAEATSEKSAMVWYLDGKVSAIVGTHTHIQTADEKILPQGTAFISDIGMLGSFNSIIGVDQKAVLERFTKGLKIKKIEVGKMPAIANAVLLEIDSQTKKAHNIVRLSEIVE